MLLMVMLAIGACRSSGTRRRCAALATGSLGDSGVVHM